VEERLLPVNALLGLLLPNDVNRPALADAGFQLVGLEVPVTVEPGKSVVIDLLIFHAATNHLVQLESKAGANVEADQAAKYGQLKPQAVVQAAYVSLPGRIQPTSETVYLCLAQHLERVRLGLANLGLTFPIIAVSDSAARLDLAHAASVQLQAAFPGGEIVLSGRPPRMIQFDQDSSLDAVKPRVLAELVAAMSHRLPQLSLVSLAERATPHYALYGRAAQNQICRKVGEAARSIADDDPTSFQYVPRRGNRDGLVRILRTPEDNDARGRTQAYQAIGRPSRARSRAQRQPANPDQLDLLSELDVTDNESDGAPSTDGDEVSEQ
jgi:hypothetical protein